MVHFIISYFEVMFTEARAYKSVLFYFFHHPVSGRGFTFMWN